MNKKVHSTPHPPLTASVRFVRGMLAALQAKGMDTSAWLVASGIAPQALEDDQARVGLSQIADLGRLLIDRLDDEILGQMSRPMKRGSFALQARSAIGARTLESAIKRIAHTFHLLNDDVDLVLVQQDALAGVELRFHNPAVAANPHLHESLLRSYWRVFAWFIGGQLPIVRFDFAFARPPNSDDYTRVFPAPWRYDAECSALWFEAHRLRLPICRDTEAVRSFVQHLPINVLIPSRDLGVSSRVRTFLQQTQPRWPDLDATAQALRMAPSTLQRYLAQESTSFQQLKDQFRREVAILRLNTSMVPLVKLAEEMGFADVAAFQRAFKGWTGYPPGAYRRKREA